MIMNPIERYLLAYEKLMNTWLFIHKNPIKSAHTSKYLKQNRPSFATIANLLLVNITSSMSPKRQSTLRDILYIADGPTQSN